MAETSKKKTKKVVKVDRKPYEVLVANNFGNGNVPRGGKVLLCREAAEFWKQKKIIK